jgi:hypothetical protein
MLFASTPTVSHVSNVYCAPTGLPFTGGQYQASTTPTMKKDSLSTFNL